MKHKLIVVILLSLLAGCSGAPATIIPVTASLTGIPPTATEKPIVLPPPYTGTLELVGLENSSTFCDKAVSPFGLPAEGVLPLSFLPNRKCDDVNSDLDLFEIDNRLYVAHRNARGFRLVDVTDPTQPTEIGAWELEPHAIQEHITTFRQFDHRYLAMPLESPTPYGNFPCGLAIIEVTQPEAPVLMGRYDGKLLNSDVPSWCNVHAAEVDTDADGNATFLFLATLNTADLRVLDIRDLENIREVNVFHQHIHPHGENGSWAHRAAIMGNRVYISYWGGGVMIVNKHGLEMGRPPEEIMFIQPGSIDPDGFVTHDSQPTADGNFLFVNDMDRVSDGLRLFDIRDLSHPREIWKSNIDTETGQHTLQLRVDLLFVPWFREGLRIFRFNLSDPDHPIVEQIAFQSVRMPPYASSDNGIGALKVHDCQVEGVVKTCVYASDEEKGLIILALDDD
jgi:hypothetical protein